jgi:hypothetical protein
MCAPTRELVGRHLPRRFDGSGEQCAAEAASGNLRSQTEVGDFDSTLVIAPQFVITSQRVVVICGERPQLEICSDYGWYAPLGDTRGVCHLMLDVGRFPPTA